MAAGNLIQLMAPVKLRPFKSTYHVREGNQLRLICQAQRGYPEAQISWYIGNRLIDNEFLKEQQNEIRILNLNSPSNQQQQQQSTGSSASTTTTTTTQPIIDEEASIDKEQIVEINPIPISRQQMQQFTTNGQGSWIEYKNIKSERYSIDRPELEQKYLQLKLAQLTNYGQQHFSNANSGSLLLSGSSSDLNNLGGSSRALGSSSSILSQTDLSILVISSLNIDKHSSRYSCRATTRSNTDEVTTVIKVQGK